MDLRPVTDPLRGLLYVTGGWACLGLAVIGAMLPLIPTTPFVLLASWCFYRGSPRIHAWLHRSRLFGPTLDDWQHYHGIRRGGEPVPQQSRLVAAVGVPGRGRDRAVRDLVGADALR